jgi:hypothetical protein
VERCFCLVALTRYRVFSDACFARFAGALLVPALPELRCFLCLLDECIVPTSASSALRTCSFRLCRNIAVFLWIASFSVGSAVG